METAENARLKVVSKVLIYFACVISLCAVFGWIFNIVELRSLLDAGSSMKINTALGMLLLGLSGLFQMGSHKNSLFRRITLICAYAVLTLAALSAIEDLTGFNLGIDELLKADLASRGTRWAPGRPSPVTLFNFLLISFSIIAQFSTQLKLQRLSQPVAMVAWIISFQSLVAYFEGVNSQYGLVVYAQMAFQTAASFSLISSGIIISRSNRGIMRYLTSRTQAGKICRQLLFASILLPPSLFLLEKIGENVGIWGQEFGSIVRIVAFVCLFSWIALKTGSTLFESEAKERRSLEKLLHSLHSRDDFLAISSHELKTPLTSLQLQHQIFKRGIDQGDPSFLKPEKIGAFIFKTEKQAKRLSELVDNMMDIGRIRTGMLNLNRKSFDLVSLLKSSIEQIKIKFSDAYAPTPVLNLQVTEAQGNWDEDRLRQVLTILLENALRYGKKKLVTIALTENQEDFKVSVEDQGIGISPMAQGRLFQRFERDIDLNEVSGMGLGLYISREIIRAHGGEISFESEFGKGSKFTIRLPKASS